MGPELVFCFLKRFVEVKLVILSVFAYAFCQPVHVHNCDYRVKLMTNNPGNQRMGRVSKKKNVMLRRWKIIKQEIGFINRGRVDHDCNFSTVESLKSICQNFCSGKILIINASVDKANFCSSW